FCGGHGKAQLAAQPALAKIELRRAAQLIGGPALDERRAEPSARWGCNRRATSLGPSQTDTRTAVTILEQPRHRQLPLSPRQRAILCGVGRQLVEDQQEGHARLWWQDDSRAFGGDPAVMAQGVRVERLAHQLADLGAAPILVAQQLVAACECAQATLERGPERLQ